MNVVTTFKKMGIELVLIDTWWNVNMYDLSNAYFTDSVLIDTWWNVNVIRLQI